MAATLIRPQNINLKVDSGTELVPSFVGMIHLDSNNILRVDTVGSGVLADFVTVLPEHTVTGEHGPKVTITQTADDNALDITKSGLTPAVSITVTGPTGGKGLSITSASDVQQGLEIQQSGNADALHIDVNGTGRALVTEDGDVLFDDGNVAIGNGEFRVNTDRLFVDSLRVGVGTTAPDRLFDVNGGAAFRGNHLYLTNPAAPANKEAWGLVVDSLTGDLSIGPTTDVLPAGGSLTASVIQISHDAPANTFFVENSGQVGINTVAPSARFEVESADNEICVRIDKNGGTSDAFRIDNDGTGFGIRLRNSSTEEALFIEQLDVAGDCAIQINNSGADDAILAQNLANTAASVFDGRSIGSGPVIHIHSSGSGRDIEGTNASWFFDNLGNLTANNVITKVAYGETGFSDLTTLNLSLGTTTSGTYNGDTGFSTAPALMVSWSDTGLQSNTSHHSAFITVTTHTSTTVTFSVSRNNIGLTKLRWFLAGS
jgi:hypothetical protein